MLRLPTVPPRKRFRLVLRAIFIVMGVFALFVMSVLIQENKYFWALLPLLCVFIASLAEFVLADILTESRYPARTETVLDKLESNLRAYHDQIRESIGRGIASLRGCDTRKVSGTFHLVVELFSTSGDESEQALVQVTDYSGSLGGGRWRFTPLTKGIIGRCLRTGRSEWVNFSSDDDYASRMLTEFGFSRSEVERHTHQARSYWAEPVISRGRMIGVIYLFSTELQVFPLAVERPLLEGTAREIAAFLEGARIV